MITQKKHVEPASASQAFSCIAPKFSQLSDEVLFADVWERTELSKRDRSLITVSALISLYRLEQLPFHLTRALHNGVTKEELVEVATHLAFYAGWPSAASTLKLIENLTITENKE